MFYLYGVIFSFVMFAVCVQLMYSLAIFLAPAALVGFGLWIVCRLVRRSKK
jgi:hypothetical protein